VSIPASCCRLPARINSIGRRARQRRGILSRGIFSFCVVGFYTFNLRRRPTPCKN